MNGSDIVQVGCVDPPSERSLSVDALDREEPTLLQGADYVVVRPRTAVVRSLLTHLRALDPAVQIIIAPESARRPEVERALLFTPGVGEVWVAASEELGAALFSRAAEVTRRRRSYPATRAQVLRGLRRRTDAAVERSRISDAFLATLLGVVPDPVLSLDEGGKVISANPAAGRLLGGPVAKLEGSSLLDALQPDDPRGFGDLLDQGRSRRATGEVTFTLPDGTAGTAEVFVAPVHSGEHRVRCVVLHDVTEARRAEGELERQARTLEKAAAERERVNEELLRRTAELERVLEVRSRFYAGMSHELRTPLNAIIGYHELLLDGVVGELSEAAAAQLRRAQRAGVHLLDLVTDVLDLAKIEAGKLRLDEEEVRFPDVLDDLIDAIGPPSREHGVTVDIGGPERSWTVRTDPRRLRQILLNLLSNALKFGEGKPVRVEWSPRDDGGVVVAVIDRGRGIPPERLAEIFDEFVQGESGPDRGGTGLGLTISRRLAEALGARIEAESQVGGGSVFRLVLPSRPRSG